jgi:hypothetical protein
MQHSAILLRSSTTPAPDLLAVPGWGGGIASVRAREHPSEEMPVFASCRPMRHRDIGALPVPKEVNAGLVAPTRQPGSKVVRQALLHYLARLGGGHYCYHHAFLWLDFLLH